MFKGPNTAGNEREYEEKEEGVDSAWQRGGAVQL